MYLKIIRILFFGTCIIGELCTAQSDSHRGRRYRNRFINRARDENSEDQIVLEDAEQSSYQLVSNDLWLSDGSKQISFDGNTVTCEEATPERRCSAMLKDAKGGVNKDEHYWEFQIDNIEEGPGMISVGLTNPSHFKKGRGLFYSGNLESGRSTLQFNHGPKFKFGDTIGILASFFSRGKLKVYFYYNQRSLGLAYDVDSGILANAQPVVQFTTPGVVSVVKEREIPKRRARETIYYSGIEGDWKVIRNEIFFHGKPFNSQHVTTEINPNIVTLQITPRDNNFAGLIQVVNDIRFSAKRYKNVWMLTPSFTTYSGVPDYHLRILEDNFTKIINNGTATLVRKNLKLEKGISNASFERYNRIPKTVTNIPFEGIDDNLCFCPCSP